MVQLVGGKVRRDKEVVQDLGYSKVDKPSSTKRIDLNDLLERVQAEKKRDSRTNLLILSGVIGVSLIVILILSF